MASDNTFYNDIKFNLDLNLDKNSEVEIKKFVDELSSVKLFKGSDKDVENFKRRLQSARLGQIVEKDLKEAIEQAQNLGDETIVNKLNDKLKELQEWSKTQGIEDLMKKDLEKDKEDEDRRDTFDVKGYFTDKVKSVGNFFKKQFENVIRDIKSFFIKSFSEAIDEIKEMATYNLGTSIFTNTEARQQALKYGLSPSENYALSRTMDLLGMSSEEDLMWMNEKQREIFAEKIGYYTDKYNSLNSSGFFETFQDFELEWEQFKEDVQLEMITFFINNKDLIIWGIKTSIELLKTITTVVNAILGTLPSGMSNSERISNAERVLSSNTSTVNNYNNTYNYYGGRTQESKVINSNRTPTSFALTKGFGY